MTALYIHIPFCARRCKYCDFFSTTQLNKRQEYVDAVCRELELRKREGCTVEGDRTTSSTTISTIYFGGGTPTQLTSTQLLQIMNTIYAHYQVVTDAEITIECNPKDLLNVELEKLKVKLPCGSHDAQAHSTFNRLSIGIQSLNDETLQFLGRRHTAAEAKEAVRRAQRAGFRNISVDLMYGLPNQTIAQLQQDLEGILALDIQHVSTYCLSYEDGTPLTRMLEKGELTPIDDDTCNEMYALICNTLKQNGFEHYEVSNFCKPNYHSRHNSAYWDGTPYIGIGAGAHSYDGHHTRSWNCSNLEEYINDIRHKTKDIGQFTHEPNGSYVLCPVSYDILTPLNLWNERIMLSLRTARGIDIASYTADEQKWLMQQAEPWLQQGLLIHKDNHLIATQLGLNILNRIIETFLKV